MDAPRSRQTRKADALAKLNARHADLWAATASSDGSPHLVPLSYAWDGEHIIIATEETAVTTRNIGTSGRARLGLGGTRDVVMIDAALARRVPVRKAADEVAGRYAEQADWDPRRVAGDFVYLLLRPERIQVWREANEIGGRTVMRDAEWCG